MVAVGTSSAVRKEQFRRDPASMRLETLPIIDKGGTGNLHSGRGIPFEIADVLLVVAILGEAVLQPCARL